MRLLALLCGTLFFGAVLFGVVACAPVPPQQVPVPAVSNGCGANVASVFELTNGQPRMDGRAIFSCYGPNVGNTTAKVYLDVCMPHYAYTANDGVLTCDNWRLKAESSTIERGQVTGKNPHLVVTWFHDGLRASYGCVPNGVSRYWRTSVAMTAKNGAAKMTKRGGWQLAWCGAS